MYLPDTNIFIRAVTGSAPEATFLQRAIKKRSIIFSVIVLAEFYAKADGLKEEVFDRLVAEFEILPIDKNIARIAGEYRKQMLRKSKRIILLDCFLAAQAKVHSLTLVTNNKADFPMRDIKIITP